MGRRRGYRSLLPVVSLRTRLRPILASASRFLKAWACLSSSLGGGLCMTDLTWMRGLTNISAEGGPERSVYGP